MARRELLSAVALIGSVAACNAVFGVEALPRAEPEAEPEPEPLAYASEDCMRCVDAACASELEVCMGDLRCEGLTRCLAACEPNDLSCRYACAQDAPTASIEPAAVALDACRRPACGDVCLGTGGLVDDTFEPSCAACIDAACTDSSHECLADADCEQAMGCVQELDRLDPGKLLGCVYDDTHISDNPQSSETLGDFQNCWTNCAVECAVGREWSCVGKFGWGRPRIEGDVPYTFGVRYADGPAAGAAAKVCTPNDDDCSAPAQIVDDDGRVMLQLPMEKTGWDGFLSFEAAVDGPALFPQRFYFGRPLIRPENRVGTGLTRQTDASKVEDLFGPFDASRGHLAIVVWDCLIQEAVGVQLHVDGAGESVPIYFKGIVAYLASPDSVTDHTGAGLFLNVEPGQRTITATYPLQGDREVASYEVTVKAGELTQLFLNPTPEP